jgi:hypothetical protein
MQMLRYMDPKKGSESIKAFNKELNIIIDSGYGALNNNEHATPNYAVVSTLEVKKIKLDQDGNVGRLELIICVRGDLKKKNNLSYGRTKYPSFLA